VRTLCLCNRCFKESNFCLVSWAERSISWRAPFDLLPASTSSSWMNTQSSLSTLRPLHGADPSMVVVPNWNCNVDISFFFQLSAEKVLKDLAISLGPSCKVGRKIHKNNSVWWTAHQWELTVHAQCHPSAKTFDNYKIQ